jgi:2-dehydro-3-deoxygluconokinase
MKSIITIGEAMGLFVANDVGVLEEVNNYTRYTAGAEMNVAIGLARLGFDTYYATQLGNDPIGRYIKNSIEKENIKSDYIYYNDNYVTGIQFKQKVLSGDPFVASYRKGSAATKFNKELVKDLDFTKFSNIHLSGIFLALSPETREVSHYFADKAKENNIITTFDPNLRPKLWGSEKEMIETINSLAEKCNIILPGISEGRILTGYKTAEDIAEFYLSRNSKVVIVKLGEKGAFLKEAGKTGKYIKGFKVERVVDTVGAGDGFSVGVISAIAEGLSMEEAAIRGNAIGAIQLMTQGDNDGLPDRKILIEYLKKYFVLR